MARTKQPDHGSDESIINNASSDEPTTGDNIGSDAVGGNELQQSHEPDNQHDDGPRNPLEGIDTGTDTGTGTSKRARRSSGSSGGNTRQSGRSKTAQKVDITDAGRKALALQIVGLHEMAGIMTGQKELCSIEQDQAEMLVLSVQNVMAQYKIKPNPKVMAWCELAGVMAMVYAPKLLILRGIREMNKEAARAARANNPAAHDGEHIPANQPGRMVFA